MSILELLRLLCQIHQWNSTAVNVGKGYTRGFGALELDQRVTFWLLLALIAVCVPPFAGERFPWVNNSSWCHARV